MDSSTPRAPVNPGRLIDVHSENGRDKLAAPLTRYSEPYRFDEIEAEDPRRWVFLARDREEVDAIFARDSLATCPPPGCSGWIDSDFAEPLQGRRVAILGRDDEFGRQESAKLAGAIHGSVAEVRIIEPPGLKPRQSISSWLQTGFKIAHLHACAELAAPWKPVGPDQTRPPIEISTEEHEVIDQAVDALTADPELYQRGNLLVRVVREKLRPKGVIRAEGSPRIGLVPMASLRERLARFAAWVRVRTTRDGDEESVAAHPPEWAIAGVAARGQWDQIRPLESIVEAPVLRPDGSILSTPGYDEGTGLLYEPNAAFPPIPESPARHDARAAAARLLALVADFPFAGAEHRAVWLASVLTPLARFAIPGPCPLFLFDANAAGSGKTLLCDIASLLATGRTIARTAYPATNEEMDKRILSIALAGSRMILFDNLETGGALGGAALDAALTGTTYGGRLLARSEMANDVPLFTVWYASGNNLGLKGDALRRIVPCRLESAVDRPEERSDFTIPDLLQHVRDHRGELVAAALTILRAYAVAGWPEPDEKLTPMGSYSAWCRVVRQAVSWATGLDPCRTREAARAADEVASQLPGLLRGWESLCREEGKDGLTAAEALQALDAHPDRHTDLREIFLDWSRDGKLPGPRSIGNHFNKIRGRVSEGKSLERSRTTTRKAWFVRTTPPQGPMTSMTSMTSVSPARGENCADNCQTQGPMTSMTSMTSVSPPRAENCADNCQINSIGPSNASDSSDLSGSDPPSRASDVASDISNLNFSHGGPDQRSLRSLRSSGREVGEQGGDPGNSGEITDACQTNFPSRSPEQSHLSHLSHWTREVGEL